MKKTMLIAGAAILLAGCQERADRGLTVAAKPAPVVRATPVPLDSSDPARERVGALRYLGGVVLASDDRRFGELSALRWDGDALVAVSDNAQFVRLQPVERDGRLVGARLVSLGMLRGPDGSPLRNEGENDSEALTRDARGGWLVAFEGNHRILRYPRLDGVPTIAPVALSESLGGLEANKGVEAIAGTSRTLFACAERAAEPTKPNCAEIAPGAAPRPIPVSAPEPIARLGGVPTDADSDAQGRRYILFRSYSPADGSGAAIVRLERGGKVTPLATLRPPLTLDNMEGLAVRHERVRTVLYLMSDDNGSAMQRTLLLKFAVEE